MPDGEPPSGRPGATGDIGRRIVRELRTLGADVRVLTRPGAGSGPFADDDAIRVVEADYTDPDALRAAMDGVDVVVAALSGARPVIVDAQRALLAAAVDAGVPRFRPSDYSADYRCITPGSNRNFELRREFQADVDAAPICASSVLVCAFTDMLTGQAPLVVLELKRVLFWSDADQILDFTTEDDTARVTARVALDDDASRFVEVAGDRVSARDLARSMTRITGAPTVCSGPGRRGPSPAWRG
ncbi:NmrA family NAD(P)-binding protein [Frigoribacterium sp. RIT-PI-h]|uniref:NmrA family NAD(P)-binding protein n=1 Tax=Frigoribacterium sp. RIT-PI-h TaxID=1690245 RepID=UPI0035130F90